jgi:hypothetical protein
MSRQSVLAPDMPPTLRSRFARESLMPCEGDERAYRHVEVAQLGGAAEVRQIDDEAAGENLRAELAQELTAPSAVPPVAIRSSTTMTRSPFFTASSESERGPWGPHRK